jgi:SHS2 domain-containing protein
MKNYFLDSHIADIKIVAKGDTYTELFSASLEGLCSVIKSDYNANNSDYFHSEIITIDSIDISALLIDFLSKALTIMHNDKVILHKAEFISLSDNYLEVKLSGTTVHIFYKDVKAVTYHDAEIKRLNNQFQVNILLDI